MFGTRQLHRARGFRIQPQFIKVMFSPWVIAGLGDTKESSESSATRSESTQTKPKNGSNPEKPEMQSCMDPEVRAWGFREVVPGFWYEVDLCACTLGSSCRLNKALGFRS